MVTESDTYKKFEANSGPKTEAAKAVAKSSIVAAGLLLFDLTFFFFLCRRQVLKVFFLHFLFVCVCIWICTNILPGTIYDALEQAGLKLMSESYQASVELVNHKVGLFIFIKILFLLLLFSSSSNQQQFIQTIVQSNNQMSTQTQYGAEAGEASANGLGILKDIGIIEKSIYF